jgi:hypothetical protein
MYCQHVENFQMLHPFDLQEELMLYAFIEEIQCDEFERLSQRSDKLRAGLPVGCDKVSQSNN